MRGIARLHELLLDLIGKFSYEGLPRTKSAILDAQRFPVLVENEIRGHRFRCTDGVPLPFIMACINSVHDSKQYTELFGDYPSVPAELRYLQDRQYLDHFRTTYAPELGGFINPFTGKEIVSLIERDASCPKELRIRWRVPHSIDATVNDEFCCISKIDFYKLRKEGHDLLDSITPPKLQAVILKRRGRPKGKKKKKIDELDRFVAKVVKRYGEDIPIRIPVKELVAEFKRDTGKTVTVSAMRGRMRRALGRDS